MRRGLIVSALLSVILPACGQPVERNVVEVDAVGNETAATPAAAQKPPNYTEREGDTYLYTTAVSEEDQKKGISVGRVVIYRYRGRKDDLHVLEHLNSDGKLLFTNECSEPCRIIRSRGSGTLEHMPFDPRSVIGSAFEDAMAGRLQVAKILGRSLDKAPARVPNNKSGIPAAFIGEWNSSVQDCGTGLNDSALEVTPDKIGFYESEGVVTAIRVENARAVTVKASLAGEGETWEDSFRMVLSASGDALTIDGLTRYRCS